MAQPKLEQLLDIRHTIASAYAMFSGIQENLYLGNADNNGASMDRLLDAALRQLVGDTIIDGVHSGYGRPDFGGLSRYSQVLDLYNGVVMSIDKIALAPDLSSFTSQDLEEELSGHVSDRARRLGD
jgi:hypothetical protein